MTNFCSVHDFFIREILDKEDAQKASALAKRGDDLKEKKNDWLANICYGQFTGRCYLSL
jgi:hypothetical protein